MDKREICIRFMDIIGEWGEACGFEIPSERRFDLAELLWYSIENKIEKLKEALSQTHHFIVFSEKGWSLEHLVECRPNMAECEIHKMAQEQYSRNENWREVPHGRYRVRVFAGVLNLQLEDY